MLAAWFLASVIVSLNPCFDDWSPQWLATDSQWVPTTVHGQRLEAIVQHQPDIVLAGSFVGRPLRLALSKHVKLVTLPYVTSMKQWEQALVELASEVGHEPQIMAWRAEQQRQLDKLNLEELGQILVLMPNAYTWGQRSWVADLLQTQGGELSPLMGEGQLLRLSLEDVLLSSPDTVILEGFSTTYARAHDWLWHRAMQDWLEQRQVLEVNGEIAGCSDIRAVDYLQSLVNPRGDQ